MMTPCGRSGGRVPVYSGMRKVRTAQDTVLANGEAEQAGRQRPGKPTESATENTPPKPLFGAAGKGEKVR